MSCSKYAGSFLLDEQCWNGRASDTAFRGTKPDCVFKFHCIWHTQSDEIRLLVFKPHSKSSHNIKYLSYGTIHFQVACTVTLGRIFQICRSASILEDTDERMWPFLAILWDCISKQRSLNLSTPRWEWPGMNLYSQITQISISRRDSFSVTPSLKSSSRLFEIWSSGE